MQKKKLSVAILLTGMLFALVIDTVMAPPVAYSTGDVFVGVGGGKVKHFSPTGTLLDTLDSTTGSAENLGMAFDTAGNLYSTCSFGVGNTVAKYDNMGNLLDASWGGPYNLNPESISIDMAGNIYVGQPDGTDDVLKFDSAGTLLDTFNPAIENRGTDWIDIAADQTTLFYTSEGTKIKRYDLATKTQLADFATLPESPAYALRIRPNGEVMVAVTDKVYRLDALGAVMQTYDTETYGETNFFFAMNLDPDGTSFWTASYSTGNVYRINIETGALITSFSGGKIGYAVSGLAIFGEITVGGPPLFVIPEFPFGTILGLVASFAAFAFFAKSRRLHIK